MTELLYSLLSGILVCGGIYLLMSRHLTRLVAGLVALNHGVNLALFVSGGLTVGGAPFVENAKAAASEEFADPLPQALILTAIVITFALVAFAVVVYLRYHDETGVENVSEEGSE